jgi:hypothetical protein
MIIIRHVIAASDWQEQFQKADFPVSNYRAVICFERV